jgi:hypothetical protein
LRKKQKKSFTLLIPANYKLYKTYMYFILLINDLLYLFSKKLGIKLQTIDNVRIAIKD